MNSQDIDTISPCITVQHMFGSAGCQDAANCYWCRFAHHREAYNRVKAWAKEAQAIIGCLLTWADENDSYAAVNCQELYDLVTKARVLERGGLEAHALCTHMQTLCTHEPIKQWNDTTDQTKAKIVESVWGKGNATINQVDASFRFALADNAIQICHECGTEEATVKFCSETILEWIRRDTGCDFTG